MNNSKLLTLAIAVSGMLVVRLLSPTPTQAACNFHANMTPISKDVADAWTCTISGVEGVDETTLETATSNTAALTINSGSSITINNGGKLVAGQISLADNSSIAIADGGEMAIGSPLYVTDTDTDGWVSDFTLYDATASGRRRLALMRDFGNIDCEDSKFSLNNVCTGGTGNDGNVTFTASTNINATNRISGRSCSQGGDMVAYSVSSLTKSTATLTTTPSSSCLVTGDEVLLINLQGTSTNYNNVGNYEFFEVSSINSNTVTFTESRTKLYGNNGGNANIGTSTSNHRVMLMRVPNYENVTINPGVSVYPTSWNGVKGGVLAFKASGTVTNNGTITASGRGYRAGTNGTGGESYCGLDGGGDGGHPYRTIYGTNGVCGGGGGAKFYSSPGGSGNLGGAGGGGGAGGTGTYVGGLEGGSGGYGSGYAFNNSQNGTNGGTSGGRGGNGGAYGNSSLTTLFFGSGGGGGGACGGAHPTLSGRSGGTGGGIINLETATLNVAGSIDSKGNNGAPHTYCRTGGVCWCDVYAGGNGAGGSIYLKTENATIGTNKINATSSTYAGRIVIDSDNVSGSTTPAYTSL